MSPKIKVEVVPLSEVLEQNPESVKRDRKPSVMVVDDERIIADTLTIILSKSGYEVLTAYDGISALEIAKAMRPDLVISDVMMPGMTGIELAIALEELVPECRMLLFSGQAATVDLLEEARADGYNFSALTKPVHPTDLLRHVSKCLDKTSSKDAVELVWQGNYLFQ